MGRLKRKDSGKKRDRSKRNDTIKIDSQAHNNQQEKRSMTNFMNILDLVSDEPSNSQLERVRLNGDETPIFPITEFSEGAYLHYCPEIEIKDSVICNGDDCVLCKIRRKKDSKLLLPVYLPAADRVGVLPMSKSLRPFSLLPQIAGCLKTGKPLVMFVVRDGMKYTVSTRELQDDVYCGERVIQKFLADLEAGLIDLTSVYPKIDNAELATIDEIARMMALKGVTVK
jgi:hypothetical protein